MKKEFTNKQPGLPVHAGNDSMNNKVILRSCNSGSQPYRKQSGWDAETLRAATPFGMTSFKKGFTLIELLVVVLIIGILAAVALPQYQTAVEKARIMKYMPLGKSIKEAQELYYLENGAYSADLSKLSVESPENCVRKTGSGMNNELVCEESFFINNDSASHKSNAQLYIFYCPGHTTSWSDCAKSNGWGLFFSFAQHPSKPNHIECTGTAVGNRVCKSVNAQLQK